MNEESKQKLIDLLESWPADRLLTIESLARDYLRSAGLEWQGVFEVQLQAQIEDHLLKEGLIKEVGVTKTYHVERKVKRL